MTHAALTNKRSTSPTLLRRRRRSVDTIVYVEGARTAWFTTFGVRSSLRLPYSEGTQLASDKHCTAKIARPAWTSAPVRRCQQHAARVALPSCISDTGAPHEAEAATYRGWEHAGWVSTPVSTLLRRHLGSVEVRRWMHGVGRTRREEVPQAETRDRPNPCRTGRTGSPYPLPFLLPAYRACERASREARRPARWLDRTM